jgi:hypothetical protein
MMSVRNKLFLEPYKGGKKIEAEVKSGFATVKQRSTLIGLKLLMDAQVMIGSKSEILRAGTSVFFEETLLYTEAWAKHTYTANELVGQEFIIADFSHAVAFS